ncbi:MAG: type II secretion system protein GspE [Robiginitomaculum sp.]|nr:MAG: type II secretion system protein GspE [Robiginitomaculum sp.]
MGATIEAYLLESEMLSKESLERAKRAMTDSGANAASGQIECLGDILIKLGLLSETDLVSSYATVLNLQNMDKQDFPDVKIPLDPVTDKFLTSSRVLPVLNEGDMIRLAVSNPFDDFPKQAIQYATGKTVEYSVAPPSEIDIALDELYREKDTGLTGSDFDTTIDDLGDIDRLKDLASEAPVIRFVNRLMHQAVSRKASDIHIEPMEANLKIRLRLDGMLEEVESPPHTHKSAIISRIKIMAGLDIAERRLPQDGRIRLAVQGRDIDFRVSTTPTAFGESVVLRILNQHNLELDLNVLGFPKQEMAIFKDALEKPHGIILVTGPTGSGKTTTLYAALNILNRPTNKILTIEDPIEYMLEGINQTQVNSKIDLGFAAALRSFLRQDPDIMMVGEIRDRETAQIAVQASLTGHLILSTLHTNTAAGAVARLLDMGVEDFLLASTLNIVMAQRLVRKLCPSCKAENNGGSFHAPGCVECHHSGFQGRTMIVEVLQVTEAIQKFIRDKAPAPDIEALAISEGMQTMIDQGMALVKEGVTSREELFRVIGNDEVMD